MNIDSALTITREFDGRPLRFRDLNGQRCVVASEMARALGYTQARKLVSNITGPWSGEFVRGEDYELLEGEALTAFKGRHGPSRQPAPLNTDPVPSRARAVLVLYETGARLAAIKAQTPRGAELRRWLASVWSELERTRAVTRAVTIVTPPVTRSLEGPRTRVTGVPGRRLRSLPAFLRLSPGAQYAYRYLRPESAMGDTMIAALASDPAITLQVFLAPTAMLGTAPEATARELLAELRAAGLVQTLEGGGLCLPGEPITEASRTVTKAVTVPVTPVTPPVAVPEARRPLTPAERQKRARERKKELTDASTPRPQAR